MQTFLPYPDFELSLSVLDLRRLGKQRVEAKQILDTLIKDKNAWRFHPAIRMWRGFEIALEQYLRISIEEFTRKGGNNFSLSSYPSPLQAHSSWMVWK